MICVDVVHAGISVLHTSRSLAEICSWDAQPLKSSEGQGHFLGAIWTFSRVAFWSCLFFGCRSCLQLSGNPNLQGQQQPLLCF